MTAHVPLSDGIWPMARANVKTRAGAAAIAPLAIALPAVVLCGHAFFFAGWLIDDAGISFAYARNLAQGHGLVAQPGAVPVEGFSNPSWTLLLSALFHLGLFDPDWTPKALGLALSLAAFLVIARDAARGAAHWSAALAPLWLSLSTSFVVWTQSGLENSLLAFLLAASCASTRRSIGARRSAAWDLAGGGVAALIALTRPEGIVMACAFPLCHLLAWRGGRRRLRDSLAPVLRFAASSAVILGGYLLFRRSYFGAWLPNTYYAKTRPSLASLLDAAKLADLLLSILGPLGIVLAVAWVVGYRLSTRRQRATPGDATLPVYLGLSLFTYVVMPEDWMGEYRFATGAVLFANWALGRLASGLWAADTTRSVRSAVALSMLALTADSAGRHAARSADFASKPPAPFRSVAAFAGDGYNALADALGAQRASLLTPDVGGPLYYSRLRVHDLVGLCDVTAARTLTKDPAAFHRYVLDDIRPTFIHVHGTWSGWAAFHSNAVFSRDYLPLFEDWSHEFEQANGPSEPRQGDYVRRDALREGDAARLRLVFVERRMAAATF